MAEPGRFLQALNGRPIPRVTIARKTEGTTKVTKCTKRKQELCFRESATQGSTLNAFGRPSFVAFGHFVVSYPWI